MESLGLFLFGFVLAYILNSFLPAYFGEKGKNLATREDIGELTRKVEEVRSDYAMIVERFRATSQLRLAALDKRLQAHQEAFELWRRLVPAAHRDDIGDVVRECERWWNANCLYLSAEAREAFSDAYFYAMNHRSHLQIRGNSAELEANWKKITGAGDVIVRSVDLPPIAGGETKSVNEGK